MSDSDTNATSNYSRRAAFSASLLLASLLFFGSEILLWTNPTERPIVEWLLHLIGHIALSTVLLDFARRYRARSLYGLLLLAGLYGMGASVLIHPTIALSGMPASIFARVLGAQTGVALLLIAMFVLLFRENVRLPVRIILVVAGLLVGAAWGAWGRGSPYAALETETSFGQLFILGGLGLIPTAIALYFAARAQAAPQTLSPVGGLIAALVLLALLALRWLQGRVDGLSLTIIALLMIYCWLILWFQTGKRGTPLFAVQAAGHMPSWTVLVMMLAFFIGGVIGYLLPRGQVENDPVVLIGLVMTTFGWIWLPTVSLVIGGRAFLRQVRSQQL